MRIVESKYTAESPLALGPGDPVKLVATAHFSGVHVNEVVWATGDEEIEAVVEGGFFRHAGDDAVEQAAPTSEVASDVPANAKDVVAWIGEDKDRAAAALEAENARDGAPRKTVIAHIDSL